MREVEYDYAYMFKYSERPNTIASKIPRRCGEEVKSHMQLDEVIALQQELSLKSNKRDVGKVQYTEGVSEAIRQTAFWPYQPE